MTKKVPAQVNTPSLLLLKTALPLLMFCVDPCSFYNCHWDPKQTMCKWNNSVVAKQKCMIIEKNDH